MESLRLGLPILFAMSVLVAIVGQTAPAGALGRMDVGGQPADRGPAVVLLWAGVAILGDSEALGLVFVGARARLPRDLGRDDAALDREGSGGTTEREVAAALDAPVTEVMLAWTGVMLITALLGGVVLVAYALISRGA